jgi:flagellin
MGLRINQNIAALNAHRNLVATDNALSKSLERLSSGFRINRAADDAAGLAISEKLRAQVRGLAQAIRNAQDAISMIQTAEGALNEVHSMLQRMRELALQAANDTLSDEDRKAINRELQALREELNNVSSRTTFNGKKLLDGSESANFQVGPAADDSITVEFHKVDVEELGLTEVLDDFDAEGGQTVQNAKALVTALDSALNAVSEKRGEFGAVQNRLEHTVASLGVALENMSAAESRIRDADIAQEMVQFTRNQILLQAGTAMLAQANAAPQVVLQLLR